MKHLFFSIALILSVGIFAQKELEVSKDYTTVLIFPTEISEDPINGNDDEFFIIPIQKQTSRSKKTLKLKYNSEGNGKKTTNLLVFTADGNSYEYILKYTPKPSKLTHFISTEDAINNINKTNSNSDKKIIPGTSEVTKEKQTLEEKTDKEKAEKKYVEKQCRETLYTKKKLFGIFDKSYSVKLSLKRVSYDKDKLYLHLVFKNSGVQLYDVSVITYSKGTNNDESGFDQDPEMVPFLKYKEPVKVKGKSEHHFVIVFNSTTINENKEMNINIKELNGERNISLTITDKTINNPLKLKS